MDGFPQDVAQRAVGLDGVRPAPEDDRVARLQAERRRVHRHVGPGFVDDGDHPDGHAPFFNRKAVGPRPLLQRLAHRVGQKRDVQKPRSHVLNPPLGERQPLDESLAHALLMGVGQVLKVCGQYLAGSLPHQNGCLEERVVLQGSRGRLKLQRRLPGQRRLFPEFAHG